MLDKVSGGTGLVRAGVLRSDIIAQLNKGGGAFGRQVVSKVRIETAASGIGAIGVADINEDGTLDVVGGFSNFQPSPNNLFWMIGKGNGSFGKPTLSTTGDTHADVISLGLADVNADGHVDIVSHTLSQLSTRLGKGNGRFRPADRVRLQRPESGGAHWWPTSPATACSTRSRCDGPGARTSAAATSTSSRATMTARSP